MKKYIGIYCLYLIIVWGYFYYFYPLESFSDSNYGALAHAVFFSKLPLEWLLLYYLIDKNRVSNWIGWINRLVKFELGKTMIFSLLIIIGYGLLRLPFNLLWFVISHREGTSRQPLLDWFGEMGLDLFLYWIALSLGIWMTRILLKKYKKMWWLVLWLLILPIVAFIVYIQPVWIDPLYEDFSTLEEGTLRTSIEELTSRMGLENVTLLQVNMSEKVTTFNAYVTGIMGNARIVLWDTTLEGMEQDEILFILAHEIGHYVMNHVYMGVGGYLLLSVVLFYLAAQLYRWILGKQQTKDSQGAKLENIPKLLLILSILLTMSQPISLYVSRQMELSADKYAIEHTENLTPAMESYKRLAIQSKSDIDPLIWVKWMRYSHPSISERIELIQNEMKKRETLEQFDS
ncbi:M48 family metalloprotease [Aquibacillus kalidii]|uniref:M48 family metalloprotease n=1 Tax=Aquibacillus kalidii TaxID=2762597 RepID=UPI001644B3D5|nr:M48 family metalloprotease [Aquibacillus kalidii]